MYLEDFAAFLRTMFFVLLGFAILWSVLALVEYILTGVALSAMARNAGLPTPALAWVPIARDHLLGTLCDRSQSFHTGTQWSFSVLLPALDLLSLFGGGMAVRLISTWNSVYNNGDSISLVGNLVALASVILTAIAFYHLCRDYAPGREVLYTALGVICGGLGRAIILMTIRNQVPLSAASFYGGWGQAGGYPPQGGPYQAPPPWDGRSQPSCHNGPPGSGWGPPPDNGFRPEDRPKE